MAASQLKRNNHENEEGISITNMSDWRRKRQKRQASYEVRKSMANGVASEKYK